MSQLGRQAGQKTEEVGLRYRGQALETEAKALRGLETDLDASAQQELDLMGTETCIAPGFQEAPGEVLGQAHSFGEGLAEQAAALDQLPLSPLSNL